MNWTVLKRNRCYFEKIKEMQKKKCKLLEENYDIEKELGKVKVKNEELEEKLKSFNEIKKRNEEFEQRVKLFDEIKRNNEDLEEKSKRLEEANNLQLKKIIKLKEENDKLVACNECVKSNPLVFDISCDTNDLCFDQPIDKCVSAEVVCDEDKDESKNCDGNVFDFANIASCFDDNVGFKIMKRMGYKGQGLGKYSQGRREPIKPIMRPKYEGIGYITGKGNNTGSSKFVQETQCIQCSYCSRKGHTKDKCWDLHPCSFCGLKNHCEKKC